MGPFFDEFESFGSDVALAGVSGVAPYTFAQLEGFWIEAGGSSATAPIAAAIGMAEQGSNQLGDWVNGEPTSLGPWQIHSPNWAALQGAGIISSPSDLMNPIKNAEAAIFISGNGQNWSPWTTYGSGAYQQYLPPGTTAPAAPQSPPTGSSSSSPAASPSPVNFSPAVLTGVAIVAVIAAVVGILSDG